ncbi:J domain-containing protein [Sphingomonas sp.]|uniref:J domain-containing protein n=1 Tax=Sphingomonas sp. TaxID=28214 RepID=UPI00286EAB80|nr:J domain-containing protein [Sphingomonas sp.]
MTDKPPDHYEILGVSRTATAHEIRAAYLALMKRYHPDTAPRARRAADFVSVLNGCYAILRNPATRTEYDRALQGHSPTAVLAMRDQPLPRSSRRATEAVLLASLVGLSVFALFLNPTFKQDTQALAARAGGWITSGPGLSARQPRTALPSPSTTKRMAELARTLPADRAEQFSRRCFALSARQPQPGLADACVLFDVAFLYWQKVPGSPALPAYFADGVFDNRHREAMSDYGRAGESRLISLREMAFRGLMHSLEELRPPGGEVPLRPGPSLQKGS